MQLTRLIALYIIYSRIDIPIKTSDKQTELPPHSPERGGSSVCYEIISYSPFIFLMIFSKARMVNHIATASTASGTEIVVSNSALILTIRIFKLHNSNFPRTVYSNRVPMAGAIINIALSLTIRVSPFPVRRTNGN